jgi:ABC-type amino acid transport substrate-binding protein
MRKCHVSIGLALLAGSLVMTGCGVQVPVDPDGTYEQVVGGVLRVGASPDGELIRVDGGEVTGTEATLVEEFAASHDADVEWTISGEEQLVGHLERGELDLVVGAITDETPWVDRAGTTRAYTGIPGSGGIALVMLVPLGENRFLSELELFLDGEVG